LTLLCRFVIIPSRDESSGGLLIRKSGGLNRFTSVDKLENFAVFLPVDLAPAFLFLIFSLPDVWLFENSKRLRVIEVCVASTDGSAVIKILQAIG
jgi:hypothetical protein